MEQYRRDLHAAFEQLSEAQVASAGTNSGVQQVLFQETAAQVRPAASARFHDPRCTHDPAITTRLPSPRPPASHLALLPLIPFVPLWSRSTFPRTTPAATPAESGRAVTAQLIACARVRLSKISR